MTIKKYMILFTLLALSFNCKSPLDPIPDPCDPVVGEDFQVEVTFDYYRTQVTNSNSEDWAAIFGSFTGFKTISMRKVETDHFRYTCFVKANSYPKTKANAHTVAVIDPKRTDDMYIIHVADKILANGVELTSFSYATYGPFAMLYINKCGRVSP